VLLLREMGHLCRHSTTVSEAQAAKDAGRRYPMLWFVRSSRNLSNTVATRGHTLIVETASRLAQLRHHATAGDVHASDTNVE
jgi:hypothetical protein